MAGRTITEWGRGADSPYHVRLVAVYGKPLTSRLDQALAQAVSDDDIRQALQMFSRSVLARVRNGLKQTTYSAHAKSVLAAAMSFEIRSSSMTVTVNHPAFIPLVMGQRKEQMSWLTRSRKPIPIITDRGELIFRSATPKSMANGHWVHPGRPSTGVFEKAIKEAKDAARKHLKKVLLDRMRKALAR